MVVKGWSHVKEHREREGVSRWTCVRVRMQHKLTNEQLTPTPTAPPTRFPTPTYREANRPEARTATRADSAITTNTTIISISGQAGAGAWGAGSIGGGRFMRVISRVLEFKVLWGGYYVTTITTCTINKSTTTT